MNTLFDHQQMSDDELDNFINVLQNHMQSPDPNISALFDNANSSGPATPAVGPADPARPPAGAASQASYASLLGWPTGDESDSTDSNSFGQNSGNGTGDDSDGIQLRNRQIPASAQGKYGMGTGEAILGARRGAAPVISDGSDSGLISSDSGPLRLASVSSAQSTNTLEKPSLRTIARTRGSTNMLSNNKSKTGSSTDSSLDVPGHLIPDANGNMKVIYSRDKAPTVAPNSGLSNVFDAPDWTKYQEPAVYILTWPGGNGFGSHGAIGVTWPGSATGQKVYDFGPAGSEREPSYYIHGGTSPGEVIPGELDLRHPRVPSHYDPFNGVDEPPASMVRVQVTAAQAKALRQYLMTTEADDSNNWNGSYGKYDGQSHQCSSYVADALSAAGITHELTSMGGQYNGPLVSPLALRRWALGPRGQNGLGGGGGLELLDPKDL